MDEMAYPRDLVEEFADVQVVALYEPGTGDILHLHVVKVFRGGRPVSEQEAVETAHSEAARIGHDVTRLRAKVSTNSIHLAAPHRINVDTGEFVAAPSLEPDIGRLPGPRSE
jgi:hypothetical protein